MPLHAATPEPKTGARPLGMSAFSAVADDVNAISWNPAGLSLLQNQEATAAYAPLYGFGTDITQSYLAYAYPIGRWGTVGINLSFLNYGDMDRRDDSGKDLGSFSRKDYSVYASYGLRLIESLCLGVSLGNTSVNMEPAGGSENGLGVDLGVLYTIASRASLGLYMENVGGVSVGGREIALQKIRTGAAFSALNRPTMGLVVALDLEEQQGKLDTLYSGVEWSVFSPSSFFVKRRIQERSIALMKKHGELVDEAESLPKQVGKTSLCIRSGIRKRLAVDEPIAFSGGVCIRYSALPKMGIKIEHAFSWHPYLEATHRFSLGLEIGG